MTNIDKIRQLSAEELSELLYVTHCCDCVLLDCAMGEIGNTKGCPEMICDWLKAEAEE